MARHRSSSRTAGSPRTVLPWAVLPWAVLPWAVLPWAAALLLPATVGLGGGGTGPSPAAGPSQATGTHTLTPVPSDLAVVPLRADTRAGATGQSASSRQLLPVAAFVGLLAGLVLLWPAGSSVAGAGRPSLLSRRHALVGRAPPALGLA